MKSSVLKTDLRGLDPVPKIRELFPGRFKKRGKFGESIRGNGSKKLVDGLYLSSPNKFTSSLEICDPDHPNKDVGYLESSV